MLTKHATIRLNLPHEPGEWVEVYPLSGRRLREAKKAQQAAAMQQVVNMGADLMGAVQAARAAQGKDQEETSDPFTDYDPDTILRSSIAAWSYDQPVTDENVDDLDAVTQDYIVRELLKPTIERSKQEQLDRFLTSTAP